MFAALTLAAGPALACPSVLVDETKKAQLMESVRTATSEEEAKVLNDQLWEIWANAPDSYSQELLDEGMSRRSSYDFAGAAAAFDALVEYCPHYAEGYNQRAFVNFLRQDYDAALDDLEVTLSITPDHIGALSGRALTYMGLGRNEEARRDLTEALKLNPWLPERRLMPQLEQATGGKDI